MISEVFFDANPAVLICDAKHDMPLVKCPRCGNEAEYNGNEFRPFCSERCKLIDFGAWADENYALPTEVSDLSERDWDEIEKALKDSEEL